MHFKMPKEVWELLEERRVAGQVVTPFATFGLPLEDGVLLADLHNSRAEYGEIFSEEPIDRLALEHARRDLLNLKTANITPQERGLRFQRILSDVLGSHGCELEAGKTNYLEQVDLFMFEPYPVLIEARWERQPVGVSAIHNLAGKLERRPAVVTGIYVSMTGFTKGVAEAAASRARDRTILTADGSVVEAWADGSLHFKQFWKRELGQLIRQYP